MPTLETSHHRFREQFLADRWDSSPWQLKCSYRLAVNIRIKTKIRYNGQEYSTPAELPADARAAYEKALRSDSGGVASKKIVINGQEFAPALPADQKKLYDDVLALIQNNGAVTLPGRS